MKKIYSLAIIAVLLLGASLKAAAQDPYFTQFLASPLYLNPAYAGTSEQQRFTLINRIQWPSAPQAFTTYGFSYDLNIPVLRSGIGFLATTDKAGSVGLRTSTLQMMYSYKIQVQDRFIISPAIGMGVSFRGIDRSALLFGDQFDFSDPNQGLSGDPALLLLDPNTSYYDVSTGILIYNERAWFGASAYHINTPNQSLLGEQSALPIRYSVHAGFQIRLANNIFDKSRIPVLAPAVTYRRQENFDQLDIGASFFYNPIMVGLYYRGLPLLQNVLKNDSNDGASLMVGVRFQQLMVGYSYDITLSDLGPGSGGAHEISLVYQFAYHSTGKKKYKPIPCPSFLESVRDKWKY